MKKSLFTAQQRPTGGRIYGTSQTMGKNEKSLTVLTNFYLLTIRNVKMDINSYLTGNTLSSCISVVFQR